MRIQITSFGLRLVLHPTLSTALLETTISAMAPKSKFIRRAVRVFVNVSTIAATGLLLPTHYQTRVEAISSYHQKAGDVRHSRTQKRKKRDREQTRQSPEMDDELPVTYLVSDDANDDRVGPAAPQSLSEDVRSEAQEKGCQEVVDETQQTDETREELDAGVEEREGGEETREEVDAEEDKYQGEHDQGEHGQAEHDQVEHDQAAHDQEGEKDAEAEINPSDDGDDQYDEDALENFVEVIKALDLARLSQAAFLVRLYQKMSELGKESTLTETKQLTCDISPVPNCGSYNLAFLVTFRDGVKWIARVPGHGHSQRWRDLDRRKMDSEYHTMQLIKTSTTIPIPDVFYWESTCDFVGAPFALMSYVEGVSLAELWTDDLSENKRLDVLSEIACYMSQLQKLSFDKLGMLQFDANGEFHQVGQSISLHAPGGWCLPWHDTKASGPYQSMLEYLGDESDEHEDMHVNKRAYLPVLRMALQSMPKFLTNEQKFSLSFADFNYQNILADSDCHITGFIDWDNVQTQATCVGFARFPLWITKDYDPLCYDYDADAPHEGPSAYEDPPETLSRYRQHYAAEFKKCAAGIEGYDPRKTTLSHLAEAVCWAVTSALRRSEIVKKLLDHAFGGEVPFRFAEYIQDYTQGRRSAKDELIEKAFAKMWHPEWEDATADLSSEESASTRGSSQGIVESDTDSEGIRNDSDSMTSVSGLSIMNAWAWPEEWYDPNEPSDDDPKQSVESCQQVKQNERIEIYEYALEDHCNNRSAQETKMEGIEVEEPEDDAEADDLAAETEAEDPAQGVEADYLEEGIKECDLEGDVQDSSTDSIKAIDQVESTTTDDPTHHSAEETRGGALAQSITADDVAEDVQISAPAEGMTLDEPAEDVPAEAVPAEAVPADEQPDEPAEQGEDGYNQVMNDNDSAHEYIPSDHKQQHNLPEPLTGANQARNIGRKLKSLFSIHQTNTSTSRSSRFLDKTRDIFFPLKKLKNTGGAPVESQHSKSSDEQVCHYSNAPRLSRNVAERCQTYMCQRA